MNLRAYSYSFLTLLAIFSLWLVWYFVIKTDWETPANPHTPDAFVNHLQVTVMNAQGQWEYQFSSPHMVHYAVQDRSVFLRPHLLMQNTPQEPAWEANAPQGESVFGNMVVYLQGLVTVNQPKGAHNVPTVIQTRDVTIFPKQRLLWSEAEASAVQPAARLAGMGMRLNLVTQTLDLTQQVTGYYIPSTAPGQKPKPPVNITAQQAHFNKATGVSIFQGQVSLTQGTNHLITPQLTLWTDQNSQLKQANAEGTGTTYTGIPDPQKPPFIAVAQLMEYFPNENKIRLIGNAKATQGPNSYAAPQIDYHIDQQMVVSPFFPQGGTTIVIHPQSLQKPTSSEKKQIQTQTEKGTS